MKNIQSISLDKLLDASREVICAVDRDGRFLRLNAACETLWGYTPEELTGKCYLEFVIPEDQPASIDAACRTNGGQTLENFINHFRCKDGTIRPNLWSARWHAGDGVMYAVARDATLLVETKRSRAVRDRRLRRAYEMAEVGWWELDLASQTFTSSDEVFEIYDRPRTPGNQSSVAEFLSYVHPEDVARVQADLTYLTGEEYSNYKYRILRPSGEIVYLNNYFEVVRNGEGKPVAISGIIKNITQWVRDREELVASREALAQYSDRLSHILDTIGDGFFAINEGWTVTYWNRKLEEMSGVQRDAALGQRLDALLPAAEGQPLYESCARAFAERCPASAEYYCARLDRWLEANIYISENELLVYLKDISERKRQQERLRFIAKATAEVIWERALDKVQAEVDAAKFYQVFGYKLSGNSVSTAFWLERIHPEDLAHNNRLHDEAVKVGLDNYVQEYRFLKADGTWAHVKDRTFLVRNGRGQPVLLIGAMEDVTHQRLAKLALEQSEQSYRQLFDSAPLPTFISDAETLRYLDVNQAAVDELGYSREEFLSMTLWNVRPQDEFEAVRSHINNVRRRLGKERKQFTYLRKDGSRMLTEVSATLINHKGRQAFLATVKDITETVQLQEQLIAEKVNQQKAVTVATIEAQEKERSQIAKELHDNVNQILATAKLYISNIRQQPDMQDYFIEKGGELVQRAISENRRLSSALNTPALGKLTLSDMLEELLGHYRELQMFRVESSFNFSETFIGQSLQLTLYRILQEAFNNTVKYANASQVLVVIRTSADSIKFAYSDNGVGFDPATVKRGLGLENIQNRADAYRGRIMVSAAPGQGVLLRIVFPLGQ